MELPVLDLSVLTKGTTQEQAVFCQALLDCCTRYGFVKLVNHGIPESYIAECFDLNREFFELPEEAKAKAIHPPRPTPHRGWSPLGKENVSGIAGFQKGVTQPSMSFDNKESFDIGPPVDDLFLNIWPNEDDIPGFRGFMEKFFNACHDTHLQILRGLEMALELPERRFRSLCSNAQAEFRLTHYPPVDVSKLKDGKTTRISEHTDFGTITMLFQDSTGGLEFEDENANGRFIPIESRSKTVMIASVGDTLTWWTNKRLHSANHRVTIPIGMKGLQAGEISARLSIAYFGKANRDASLRCFPEFRPVGQAPVFDEEVTALEYNQRMTERTY